MLHMAHVKHRDTLPKKNNSACLKAVALVKCSSESVEQALICRAGVLEHFLASSYDSIGITFGKSP